MYKAKSLRSFTRRGLTEGLEQHMFAVTYADDSVATTSVNNAFSSNTLNNPNARKRNKKEVFVA